MLFYRFGLVVLVHRFAGAALPLRCVLAILLIAPLGLCLGAFMPLGLATVAGSGRHTSRRVHRLGVGGERPFLGHQLHREYDPRHGRRLQPAASDRGRCLRRWRCRSIARAATIRCRLRLRRDYARHVWSGGKLPTDGFTCSSPCRSSSPASSGAIDRHLPRASVSGWSTRRRSKLLLVLKTDQSPHSTK